MPLHRIRTAACAAAALLALSACDKGGGRPTCGLASVAGANLLLGAFQTPNLTLSAAPKYVPITLPVRVVAGPVFVGTVSRVDSLLRITLPADSVKALSPGSAVLVQDTTGRSRGIVLYDAPPVAGAPVIGTVELGPRKVPLIGINADPGRFEDPTCPLFPASKGS
jgi:hypothetical protein